MEPEVQKNNLQADDPLDGIKKFRAWPDTTLSSKRWQRLEKWSNLMQGVLGDNIRFFGDKCQLKLAHYGSAHAWHLDAPYFQG